MTDPLAIARDAALDELRRELGDALIQSEASIRDALGKAVERHAAAIEAAGLDREPPEGWSERVDRLLEYRRALSADVLEPLGGLFAGEGPSHHLLTAGSQAFRSCWAASRSLPATTNAPWPESAVRPTEVDSATRRFQKAAGRLVSKARKTGQARDLPFRSVVLKNLERQLAPRLDAMLQARARELVAVSAEIERALVAWGDAGLPAIVATELPDSEPAESWAAIGTAATELQAAFTARCEAPELSRGTADLDALFDRALAVLDGDLAVAGSFMLADATPGQTTPALKTIVGAGPALADSEAAVADRFRLYTGVLAVLAGATAVQHRLGWRVREKALPDLAKLDEAAASFDETCRTLPAESLRSKEGLDELETRVRARLEPTLEAFPDESTTRSIVDSASDSTVEALLTMIRQAPSDLRVHADTERPPRGTRSVDRRGVDVEQFARQAFDALRIERIRSAASGIVDAVGSARATLHELPDVITFAFDEARRELEAEGGGQQDRIRELVTDALTSVANSIRSVGPDLVASVDRAQSRLGNEIGSASTALVDRLVAGRVQARLLAARSGVANARAWVNETWGPSVDRWYREVSKRVRTAWRFGARLFRRGSELVAGSGTGEASSRWIRRLSDPGRVLKDVPLVYQRLFTLEPVSDRALLAGRDQPLTSATNRWIRWRDGGGVPLIVVGTQGSGVTSFVNVLCSEVQAREASVKRIELTERHAEEADLAALLAEALEVDPTDSLDGLAAQMLEAQPGTLPDLVAVDNLEHVYLRVPGGTNLVERFLTLMAETEPKTFWVGAITNSAWQIICASEPTATSQVDVLSLSPLPASDVREAIEVRHRRSGLGVSYPEPTDSGSLLRKRLSRLRDPEAYDAFLEREYFDRIDRTASGYLRLALFQWLASADFSHDEGVRMEAPERPDFSMLESLDPTQNFTLKAFLEHRTLTLAEHDRIFRLPRQESYQIFESLGNRNLIEALDVNGPPSKRGSEIMEGLRYRVRPLLVGAVVSRLRARNIVH